MQKNKCEKQKAKDEEWTLEEWEKQVKKVANIVVYSFVILLIMMFCLSKYIHFCDERDAKKDPDHAFIQAQEEAKREEDFNLFG